MVLVLHRVLHPHRSAVVADQAEEAHSHTIILHIQLAHLELVTMAVAVLELIVLAAEAEVLAGKIISLLLPVLVIQLW